MSPQTTSVANQKPWTPKVETIWLEFDSKTAGPLSPTEAAVPFIPLAPTISPKSRQRRLDSHRPVRGKCCCVASKRPRKMLSLFALLV